MKQIKIITGLLLFSTLTVSSVFADDRYENIYQQSADYYDYAKVVDVRPIYKMVEVNEPRRECWDEERVYYNNNNHDAFVPTIVGGVLGGVVGSRFGGGKGKTIATVAGTLIGGSIGRDLHRYRNQPRQVAHTEQRCRYIDEVRQEERLDGYEVRYRYKGHVYDTRMDHKPGKRIKLHVALTPVEN
jgi:uncharacterized protein YcfJ